MIIDYKSKQKLKKYGLKAIEEELKKTNKAWFVGWTMKWWIKKKNDNGLLNRNSMSDKKIWLISLTFFFWLNLAKQI